jgi:hypothetical protein
VGGDAEVWEGGVSGVLEEGFWSEGGGWANGFVIWLGVFLAFSLLLINLAAVRYLISMAFSCGSG